MLLRRNFVSIIPPSAPTKSASPAAVFIQQNSSFFTSHTRRLLQWKTPNNGKTSSSASSSGAAANQSHFSPKPSSSSSSSSSTSGGRNNSSSSSNRNSNSNSSNNGSNSKSKATSSSSSSTAGEETTAKKPTLTERFNEWRKQTSVKKLVLIHGPFFGTWYFLLNTAIQLAMASVLHLNLAGHIVESRELAAKVGMQERFDAYANKTYYLLKTPIAVNGRFIANYIVVVTMMTPMIPVKISWTLGSYPFVLKLIPKQWRPVWKGNIKTGS